MAYTWRLGPSDSGSNPDGPTPAQRHVDLICVSDQQNHASSATALLLLLILAAWAPALPTAGASDASIVTNTTWNGDVTLTGNLTVEAPPC
ncbi:MAG: hypothetical protein CM15mP79_0920 [Methanobacteriota archaeon]|nr:MAG: hypothetical protein CM15mP79_0920 [Euryarchaeota archaeon]